MFLLCLKTRKKAGPLFLKNETLFHDCETGFLKIGTSQTTARVDFMITKLCSDILKHRSNILKLTVRSFTCFRRVTVRPKTMNRSSNLEYFKNKNKTVKFGSKGFVFETNKKETEETPS